MLPGEQNTMTAQPNFNARLTQVNSGRTKVWGSLTGICLLLTGVIVFAFRTPFYLGFCTGCMRVSGEGVPSALYSALLGGGLGLAMTGILLIVLIYQAPALYRRILTLSSRTVRSIITIENDNQTHRLNWVVIGMFGASIVIVLALRRWVSVGVKGERTFETFQELSYLIAAGGVLVGAYRLRGTQTRFVRLVYVIIGLAALLFFLEEISWGQKLLGFETPPAISSRNQQQEFNLHNLYIVDQVDEIFAPLILAAIVMALAHTFLKSSGTLTATADLILPDVYTLVPLVFSFLFSLFLASSALRAAIDLRGIFQLHYHQEQEIQETFIALSGLIYGVSKLKAATMFNQGQRFTPYSPSEAVLRAERRLALGFLIASFVLVLAGLLLALFLLWTISKDRLFPPDAARIVDGCVLQTGAQCPGVNLAGLDLRGVDLSESNMPFANMRGADLTGANLSGANLNGADLTGADLSKANLVETNFQGAQLGAVDMTGADLAGAVVAHTNLSEAIVSEGQLAGALQHFQGTTLPDGYQCSDSACSGSYLSP